MKSNSDRIIYYAGLFDGEGCISISSTKPPRKTGFVRCTVGMTCLEPLEGFQRLFGGSICLHHSKCKRNQRQVYQWSVWTMQAFNFLKLIYPYLIVKKAQADVALDFQSEINRREHRTRKLTLSEVERRLLLKRKLEVLNKGAV